MDGMKAVAFDLDGVILDAKELHRDAFIEAACMNGCEIDVLYHEHELEALSTRQKTSKLVSLGKLDPMREQVVFDDKQRLTAARIPMAPMTVPWIPSLLAEIRRLGYRIGMCSNSVRSTIEKALESHMISGMFDVVVSNEDVARPKPDALPYLLTAHLLGVEAKELIVFEDSRVGIRAARSAGCVVYPVFNAHYDLGIERVRRWIDAIGS